MLTYLYESVADARAKMQVAVFKKLARAHVAQDQVPDAQKGHQQLVVTRAPNNESPEGLGFMMSSQ